METSNEDAETGASDTLEETGGSNIGEKTGASNHDSHCDGDTRFSNSLRLAFCISSESVAKLYRADF